MHQKHNVQTTCTSLGYNISHQISTKSTEWSMKSNGQNIVQQYTWIWVTI